MAIKSRYITPLERLKRKIAKLHRGKVQLVGVYHGTAKPSAFRCDAGHVWLAFGDTVLAGKGCKQCGGSGFNPKLPAIVYYLRIEPPQGEPLYKIGITNRSVEKRFSKAADRARITVLWEKHFEVGLDAARFETDVVTRHRDHLYQGEPFLIGGGHSEMFTRDVLA